MLDERLFVQFDKMSISYIEILHLESKFAFLFYLRENEKCMLSHAIFIYVVPTLTEINGG